ncbi:acyl carrier protein [Candidatus Gottesmanbacteria bacterium]|nr:acyl carrier protein [Candidatus Gottesmanbacteria bacterium]
MFGKKEEKVLKERKQAISLKIKPIVARQLGIDEERIVPTAKIVEDLGADSLDAIEIVMALEEAFNIEILDEDQEKMKTVEDIVVYLVERIKV